MITVRKTISMRYLIFGLLISLTTLGASCKKNTSYIMHGEFHFVNDTDHSISYKMAGYDRFNIGARSSVLIKETQDGAKTVEPSHYASPLISQGIKNSFVVRFDTNKCWETVNADHSPLEIKNYNAEKLGERTYKFTFTYTEADYQRAVNCN